MEATPDACYRGPLVLRTKARAIGRVGRGLHEAVLEKSNARAVAPRWTGFNNGCAGKVFEKDTKSLGTGKKAPAAVRILPNLLRIKEPTWQQLLGRAPSHPIVLG